MWYSIHASSTLLRFNSSKGIFTIKYMRPTHVWHSRTPDGVRCAHFSGYRNYNIVECVKCSVRVSWTNVYWKPRSRTDYGCTIRFTYRNTCPMHATPTDISQYRLRFGSPLLYNSVFHLNRLTAQLSYEGRAAVEGGKSCF
jgi:hypothetical protein